MNHLEMREQAIRNRLVPILGEPTEPLFRRLLTAFYHSARTQHERLRAAFQAGVTVEVRKAAHTLVGMSLNLALADLADISKHIEIQTEQGVPPDATILDKLEAEMNNVLTVVSALLA